eukprot:CAMPEP_0174729426 /NCGR_PEP_ID=MMETSP1094-20130205/53712_1 /TAXON_ID=156173 /ORGANISM="Chrysochromulina brevifilum, Strain UTEX LB 985" /LENGTH=42 /DNA_ID= /DNA_START= /DNA_END= /DNA_ORIENTATION=
MVGATDKNLWKAASAKVVLANRLKMRTRNISKKIRLAWLGQL